MRLSGPDIRFNSATASMVTTRNSQDISAQLMLFYTTYTKYNDKLLAGVKKPAIVWDKFKLLALRRCCKVLQKEKEGENDMLICIYFGIKGLVLILIMNSRIFL